MADVRVEKEAKEDELKEINGRLEALKQTAVNYLTELKRDSYRSPVGTVSIREYNTVATPKTDEDKMKLFDFLREKDIFIRYATVNSKSLNSLYKACLEEANQAGELNFEIPGVGAPKMHRDISFRKV